MSPKVLGRAGTSLADIYDIEGSIAGVDQLLSEEVHLEHEMGGAIFSERLVGTIERITTGALTQNTNFNFTAAGPPGTYRVLNVYMQADTAARVLFAQVSLQAAATTVLPLREIPIFIWDDVNDVESRIRIIDNGAAVGGDTAMIQTRPMAMPTLGLGTGQRLMVGDAIVFRGVTAGFGAGTVEVVALLYVARAEIGIGRLPQIGLPLPGW